MLSIRPSIILCCALLFGSQEAFSQAVQQNWATFGSSGGFDVFLSIYDKDGQAFANPAEDVTGSPFFLAGWTVGAIRIHDSVGYRNIPLKLNLITQEVHFLNRNKLEMALPKGLVKEMVLLDSSSKMGPQVYTFQCGFPPVDNQDQNNFYRVLVFGRLSLLESIRKVVVNQKNDVSGEERKDIKEYDDFYLYRNGSMQRLKKDKTFVLSLMTDQQDKVGAFIGSNKTNFKSMDDIGRLIAYYDGLP